MTRLAASRAGRAQPRALARKDKEMTDKELIAKAVREEFIPAQRAGA